MNHSCYTLKKTVHCDPPCAGQSSPEEVLRFGLGSSLDGAWRLQRVRLSPGEKMLAATVKTPQREEARCVVVRLGKSPLHPPEPALLLEDVFSFGEGLLKSLLLYRYCCLCDGTTHSYWCVCV